MSAPFDIKEPENLPPLTRNILRPLGNYYRRPDVEEMVMNRFGKVMLKCAGKDWIEVDAPELDQHYIYNQLCRILANLAKAKFHPDTDPILKTDIPGEPYRFTAVTGSIAMYDFTQGTSGGIGLCVRSLIPKQLGFSNFGLEHGKKLEHHIPHGTAKRYSEDFLEDLIMAIQDHRSILISGATFTGKTSFLDICLRHVPLDWRVVTMQDIFELQVPHLNRIHLKGPGNASTINVTWDNLIDAGNRLSPDTLVGGEFSRVSTIAFYRGMTTGHQFMSSIHAASPKEAISAIIQNLKAAGDTADYNTLREVLCEAIGRIVQINRRQHSRFVSDISIPVEQVMTREIFDEASRIGTAAFNAERAAERFAGST